MALTIKEIKQRHFDKVYREAKLIECACGCGKKIKSKDKYGRDVKFVNGHNGRRYEDPTQYKREWNHRNKEAKSKYRKEKRHERKGMLIIYKGGECMECRLKYDGKNGCLFDFHHNNPKEKEFGISGNVMEKSIKKLKIEADKCSLLCANCHRPKHAEEY